jgi:hypothetical protein
LAEPDPAILRDGRTRPKRALVFSGGGARGAYEFAAFFSDEPFEQDL